FQPHGRYIMPMIIPFMYIVVKGIEFIINSLIKNEKIKNIFLITLIIIWAIMPIYISFEYIIK
ncbi:MAG: hypothetical protein ACI4VQ_04260, partial [Clostridia bacterium]